VSFDVSSARESLLRCLVLFFLLLTTVGPTRAGEGEPVELVVLNWSEYMDPGLLREFERYRHVRIRETHFESDDDRDELLLHTGPQGFDLILVNGVMLETYRRRGWIQPLPRTEQLPNLSHIEQRWIDAFPSARGYAVPYFWGTLGIAYRSDLVDRPITTWRRFFQPSERLCGHLMVIDSSRDLIGMALKALGHSANSEDPGALREAEALLLQQKPCVARYGYIRLDHDSALVKGSIVATMVYGGDALNVSELDPRIRYVVPREGSNVWVDYFVISAASPHPELAAAFLDFINDPERAARNARELHLATPNTAARALLPREMLDDPVIYPDESSLKNAEFYRRLSTRAARRRAAIVARVLD